MADLCQQFLLDQLVDRPFGDLFRPAEQFGHVPQLRRADGGEIQFEQFRPRLRFANGARLCGQVGKMPRGDLVDVGIAPRARL